MPTNKPPRKRRNLQKTRGHTGAITRLLMSTEPMPLENAIDVAIFARNSLDAMRTGRGDDDHYGALANVTNIGFLLAERGIGEEAWDAFRNAQLALLTLHERKQKHGRYTLTASELNSVRDAITYHELQVQNSTTQEVRDALTTLRQRLATHQVLTLKDPLPSTQTTERKRA
jgi:hypothetical protein